MLDVGVGDVQPVVLALLPDRIIRAVDDIRVVQRAERDGDELGEIAPAVIDRRAAFGAEVIDRRLAAVGGALPLLRLALGLDAFGRPPCLRRERAPCSLLAGKAVTDRHPDRFAADGGSQLPAPAGGGALGHFAAFLSARRTSASSVASAPSSS